ncbi:hypothetical protein [Bacteroides faecis]|uniref:hypothetical protein n=1 Tax=Bacteroides faecis TaxID=674529 RepID=UPI0027E368A0|nr:hypothetical protein [Bacteroides faecis]
MRRCRPGVRLVAGTRAGGYENPGDVPPCAGSECGAGLRASGAAAPHSFCGGLHGSHAGLVRGRQSRPSRGSLGNPPGGVRREDGGLFGGGGRQVPLPAARPPANAGAGGEGGGGVGGVSPSFRQGEAGAENAGAVAEMRRTRLDVVRGDTVEGTLAGSVPDGVPELSRYDTCPSPCRPAARGELLQRVLAVPPDGADDGREIHLRADGGLLRGKADGGQVHGSARRSSERP